MTVESGGLGCCPLCVHGGAQDSKPCNRFWDNFLCWEYVPDLLKNYGMELDPDWAEGHGVTEGKMTVLPIWNGFMPVKERLTDAESGQWKLA